MTVFIKGNQLLFLMSMFFFFSAIYTMVFYYNQASDIQNNIKGLDTQEAQNVATTESSWISGITQGLIDDLLGAASFFSPFALVKLLFKVMLDSQPDLYTFLDLLLLRPIGWVGAFITTEWVIDKIRGVSE